MRFVDGANLHEVIKRAAESGPAGIPSLVAAAAGANAVEPCSEEQWYLAVAALGRDAATALAAAHAEGVLHRDLKPANLLLDRTGRVALADFGLAKGVSDVELTSSQSVVGTLQYMAPEQLRRGVEPRSDVYALGLCLLELAARKPAFTVDSQAQLLEQIVRRGPPRARDLDRSMPLALATIIDAACAHRIDHRYGDAASLAADLAACAAGEKVHRRPRRSWAPVVLAAAAVLLLGLGLGLGQLAGGPSGSVASQPPPRPGQPPPAAVSPWDELRTADGELVTPPPHDPDGRGLKRDAHGYVIKPPPRSGDDRPPPPPDARRPPGPDGQRPLPPPPR